jgi:glycosyltransferase involved in cell wall biosynthesis
MRSLIIAREFPVKHRDILISSMLPVDFNFSYIVWNRKGRSDKPSENTYVYTKPIKKLRSLKYISIIKSYIKFIDKIIKEEKPELLIISHYSLFLPFILFSKEKKNIKIILDVHDLPSFTNVIPFKLTLFIEKLIIRKIDYVILASKYFKKYYPSKSTIVLDNIPPINHLSIESKKICENGVIKIAFVGALRYPNLYKILIESVSSLDNVELHFYGSGTADEELLSHAQSLKVSNVFFHGRFNKNDIKKIYSNIDLLWACYPSDNYNVKYATSNKCLESLYFKTPCVYSKGTMLAEDFKRKRIGFSIEPNSKDEIFNFLESLQLKDLNVMQQNIKKQIIPEYNTLRKKFQKFIHKL